MGFEKNQIVVVKIEDMGTDGEGIGKIDGYTLFVKDALIGDLVEAKILKPKKSYAYARLEKILEPSNDRIEPPCPYHRQCGGCQIQALSYDAQLRYKENKVRNNLMRIGKFDAELIDEVMEPIVGMQEEVQTIVQGSNGTQFGGFRYRNKAQYPVGTDKDGNLITGFYAGRTHSIIANTDCLLGVDINRAILEAVLSYMKEHNILAYDEESGKGLVRHVLIREGFRTGEIMVCLVVNGKSLPDNEKLIERLREAVGVPSDSMSVEGVSGSAQNGWKLTSVSLNSNQENTNVILGNRTEVLWGQPYITDYIKDIVFQISPQSFFQVNPIQTEKLYSKALEYAGLTGNETVWDLYCGIGTISLFLAKQAKQVYGVEIVPEAIQDAKRNAEINGIVNAEFFVGKAEEVLPAFYEQEAAASRAATADVIVVDPPRKGCDEVCLNTMIKMQPKRIVYVSCDSATLARDLKYLCEGGYAVRKVQAVDQFGQTVHVETVCLLSKLHEAKHHVSVKLDMDELDLTASESKATYEEIKKYVAEHYDGMKVTNLYIAQVMRKCGIELAENFNLPKWEGAKGLGDLCSERTGVGTKTAKQPQCPKEKEDAIVEALKHFKMI